MRVDENGDVTVDENGYFATRDFPNGIRAGVCPMTFGKGRINVATIAEWEHWVERAYCYESVAAALVALFAWDGEGDPAGWFRSPDTGRRRPDGDPAREFIRP
jgi:hypothetical protein